MCFTAAWGFVRGAGSEDESEDGGDDERDEDGEEEGEPGRDFGVGDVGEGEGGVGGGEGAVVREGAPEAGADGGDGAAFGNFVRWLFRMKLYEDGEVNGKKGGGERALTESQPSPKHKKRPDASTAYSFPSAAVAVA